MTVVRKSAAALSLLALVAGCSSIESTHVVRDQFGVAKGERFDGVPIVVTVPDKLGFLVTEKIYEVTREVAQGDEVERRVWRETETTMSDTPIPLGKSELFTMDPRRPASGTGHANIDLAGQYPTKIDNNVTDSTITDLAEAAAKVKETLTPEAGETEGEVTRVLVSQRQYMLVYDPRTGRFEKM